MRDLLLGKTPDDLDVSLCLRECAGNVSIGSIMAALPSFAKKRPDLQARRHLGYLSRPDLG